MKLQRNLKMIPYTDLNPTDHELKYIFHLSDIHIRPFQRHEEYRRVFESLYRWLQEWKTKHVNQMAGIVICGDILHNKNELTPECEMLTLEFLHSLADIFPTFLIAGNHDAVLNNRDRLDSLSSILYHRKHDSLYYLRTSGLYRWNNVVFVVHSLLDEYENIPNEWMNGMYRKDGDHWIALYHGGVGKFRTNSGWESTSDYSIEKFSAFDMVLLGDIHYFQYLDPKKRIAYCGSLISQNMGETDPYHGFLQWNLKDYSSEHVRVYNEFAFQECVLDGNVLRETHGQWIWEWKKTPPENNIPQRGTIRMIVHDMSDEHFWECKHRCKTIFPSIKWIHVEEHFTPIIHPIQHNNDDDDECLIRQYIDQYVEIEEQTREDMIQILLKYRSQEIEHQCQHWEWLYMEFTNMFSYGGTQMLDLRTLTPHEVIGILGMNSSGKSTLIDVLTFLLFGKITRYAHGQTIPKEVIHVKHDSFSGEVGFRVGGRMFVIRKQGKRQKNGKITMKQQFYHIHSDGQREEISMDQRRSTDKEIIKYLGTLEHLLFTSFALQAHEKSFRDLTQGQRKEYLFHLLQLDTMDTLKRQYEEKYKEHQVEIKQSRERVGKWSLLQWTKERDHFQSQMTKCVLEKQKYTETLAGLEERWQDLHRQFILVNVSKEQFIEKQTEFDVLRRTFEQYCMTFEDFFVRKNTWPSVTELTLERVELEQFNPCPSVLEPNDLMCTHLKKWLPSNEDQIKDDYEKFVQEEKRIWTIWENRKMIEKKYIERKRTIDTEIQFLKTQMENYNVENIPQNVSLRNIAHGQEMISATLKTKQEWIQKRHDLQEEMDSYQISKSEQEWNQLEHISWCVLENLQMEFHQLQLRHDILQSEYKETFDIEYNPTCSACDKNPFRHRKLHLQTELNHLECEQMEWKHRYHEAYSQIYQTLTNIWKEFECEEESDGDCTLLKKKWTNLRREYMEKQKKVRQLGQEIQKCHAKEEECIQLENTYRIRIFEMQISSLQQQWKKSRERADWVEYEMIPWEDWKTLRQKWDQYHYSSTIPEYKARMHKLQQYESFYQEYNDFLIRYSEMKVRFELEKRQFTEFKCQYQKELEICQQNEQLNVMLDKIKRETETCQKELDRCTEICIQQETQFAYRQEQFEQWRKDKMVYDEMIKMSVFEKAMIKILDKDGLPLFFLQRYLPKLESKLNDLLTPFLHKQVHLCIENDDILLSMDAFPNGDIVRNFYGGMESFMIDVALKIIFSRMAKVGRSNFFIIDEGISVLDKDRLGSLQDFFSFLTCYFDHIFIISHIPMVQEVVHHSYQVIKSNEGYSRLVKSF